MGVPMRERRQQLIEAAVRLMWRDGVEHANLRAIAKEAAAPLASVHYCFTDKDELMQAAVQHWLQELVGSLAEEVEIEQGVRAVVLRIAEDFWTALEKNPPNVLAQLELALWSMRGSAHEALATVIYPQYAQVLGDVFERAMLAHGDQITIPTEQLARSVVGILDAGSMQFLADRDPAPSRAMYSFLVEAVLDKCVVEGRSGRKRTASASGPADRARRSSRLTRSGVSSE